MSRHRVVLAATAALVGCGALAGAFLVCVLAAGVFTGARLRSTPAAPTAAAPTAVASTAAASTPVAVATPQPEAIEMTRILEAAEIPVRDLVDLARRLKGIDEVPTPPPGPAQPIPIGTTESFFVLNSDTEEHARVRAVLRAATPHVYFWIQDGVPFDDVALRETVDRFEEATYPTNRAFFGSEWTPGVDGDPHLYILLTRGMGDSVAGYFSSQDEYPTVINPYSNRHEMFYLNADHVELGSDYDNGVLAHEFQHMIHWANDLNEESWVNEGFSELSAFLNGYDTGGFDETYLLYPDVQLNAWPGSDEYRSPHYGASFLFLAYFLHRFGDEATQALVAHPDNGLVGMERILADQSATGPASLVPRDANDVFADWTVANYLRDPALDSGRYSYPALRFSASPTETVSGCPASPRGATVKQYGADYIRVTCRGPITFHFRGPSEVPVVPTDIRSGEYAFWSNHADESDITLTRSFDLSSASGPLTLRYSTWFDIESNYDYLYVVASTDGGKRWTMLTTPSGTDTDPTGANFGWGYTGTSGGGGAPEWVDESVDLSPFAGMRDVRIRFEYVTDAAVLAPGFLLDDVRVPEIGYREDFENGEGDWEAAGFVRLNNRLPQTFRVQAIERGPNGTRVTPVELDETNTGEFSTTLGEDFDELVVVVSGTTRFTEEAARYEYWVE